MPFDPSRRILEPEALDTLPAALTTASMRDLARLNSWAGGSVLPSLFRQFATPADAFTVLDVGAGSGDAAARLVARFPRASVVSLDRRPEYLAPARPPRVAADAFRLPFRDRAFDFVAASLFLHHFADDDAISLVAAFLRLARRAVFVVDLERHPLAYRFLPATRRLFRWHELMVHDGCISVQAAFRKDELVRLAKSAGADGVIARAHRPWFRLSLTIPLR